MMPSSEPLPVYKQRIEDLSTLLSKLKKKKGLIAWGRFFALIAIIASFYYLKPYGLTYAFIPAILFFAIFLRLVVLSVNNNQLIRNHELLIEINQQELVIASGQFTDRPDGSEFLPSLHDYAHDLDIFGRASIYQYFNRTSSGQGHQMFANWLLNPAPQNEIPERQEASKELSAHYEWRQQLQAFGIDNKITIATQQQINNWINKANQFAKPHWKWIRFVAPAIMLTALLCWIIDLLPSPLFWGLAFVFLLLSLLISRKVMPAYVYLDKVVKQITTLSNSLQHIESKQFNSLLMLNLQAVYKHGQITASSQVQGLKGILERLDLRLNPFVFIPLNTFLFWDLQQVLALEKWKVNNKQNVIQWFEALGQIEALSTIATIQFNNPSWAYPVISKQHGDFIARSLGHPLIPALKRITSSFQTSSQSKIALITGSNMAGKSTFLRSVGVNIVLAMMGAPVCAESLTVSHMRVISSMRISDNLEENTSTFYAELKKLKHIIEAVNHHEKIFLLLDEILRGTNSLDRQVGSKALINQLIRKDAVGMLATHDLELAGLANIYPANIHNYHFDVQVDNEELYFDYKLKEGVCKSLNASILMKKIGIEL